MKKNNYLRALGEQTTHYKLYKAKKNWVIAGITLFGFGLGAAGLLPTTSVSAATVATETTSNVATTDVAATSAAAASSTAPANSVANSAATSVAPASVATSSADSTATSTGASKTPVATSSTAVSTAIAATASSAASVATSSAATLASSAVASSAVTPTYKTTPVKGGTAETASIAPTTAGNSKVAAGRTNFTVNFTAATGDVVTVRVDGVDVSDTLFSGSNEKYTSISNVTKAPMGVNTVTNNSTVSDTTNQKGAIVNTITQDGSYSQSFDLTASLLTYYSPTATAVTTATATKKIQVYINGILAASTTYDIDYKVTPVRLLSSAYYNSLGIYSTDPVSFVIPNFGASSDNSAYSLRLSDLKLLNAKTAEYRIPMPVGFVLDEAATANLVKSYPITITQDATNGDVVLKYNDISTMTYNGEFNANIQGSFTGYVAGTSVTVDRPNTVTVVTNDGQTLTSVSDKNNTINYATETSGSYTNAGMRDYNESDTNNIYVDLQRAKAANDSFIISSGMTAYNGPALANANSVVKVPVGLTTKALTVTVAANMLTTLGVTELPYQVTYTDGSNGTGKLVSGSNIIALDAGKTLQEIDYQFDIPAVPKTAVTRSAPEPVTNQSTSNISTPSFVLPSAAFTFGVDDSTEIGDYLITSQLSGIDSANKPFDFSGNQTVKIIDGQTAAYLSFGSVPAQNQTSTSAGEILTGNTSSNNMSVQYPKKGLTLSNGETSAATDVVANFLNQPIFYFIAPTNTHFTVDMAKLTKNVPGIQLTSYQTSDGHQAYKIDLSKATSQDFYLEGYNYSDSQPIGVTGVFQAGILSRLIAAFEIQADPDAASGTDTMRVYYTTQNQVNDISASYDTNGAMTGNNQAIAVTLTNNTYTIKNISGIFGMTMVQGSNDSGYSRAGTTSIYQPLADNQFALNIENVATTPLTNVSELINLPTVGDTLGSAFAVQLTGAATSVPTGVTVLYSTTAQTQKTTAGSQPDVTGYLTAAQVTDWSAIKSILIQTVGIDANASLGRVVFNIEDPTQIADVNKTAYFDSGTYADNLTPIILGKASAATLTIKGTATINYAFQLPDGTTVPAPNLSQIIAVGTDKVATPLPTIKSTDLPTGYRLINANGQAITSTANTTNYKVGTIQNSSADYTNIGGTNGTAVVGQVATYDVDGDTILIPLVDTNTQNLSFEYLDQTTGKTLTPTVTSSITGMSLTPVPTTFTTASQIAAFQKLGYVLVSDATKGVTLTFDADTTHDQVYQVVLKHGTTIATVNTPGTPNSPITTTGTAKWPTGTTAADLKNTVTRTIHYVYSDGGTVAKDASQTADFQRVAVVDNVTGDLLGYLTTAEVTAYKQDATTATPAADGKWLPASTTLAAITNPTPKAGYSTTDKVIALAVKQGDTNVEQTVTYSPDEQKATVTYVDASNGDAVLQIDTLTGVSNGTQDYTAVRNVVQGAYEKLGYVFFKSGGTTLLNGNIVTFDTNTANDQNTTIYLKHNITVVTPNQPGQPGTPIDNTSNNWPSDTGSYNLNRTITQTIHYVDDQGNKVADDVTQTVTYQRAAAVDHVTGAILGYMTPSQVTAYTNDPTTVTLSPDNGWTATAGTAAFISVASPAAKAGYTPDLAATAAYTATPTTGNADLTITYAPDAQKATVTYVDVNAGNKVLQTDQLTGVSNGTLDYTKVRQAIQSGYEKLGYVYDHETGNALGAGNVVTFDTDGKTDQATTIYLKHGITTVTPDQPQTPGEPIPNAPSTWPAGTTAADLNRTVTEKVQFIYANGGKVAPDQIQTVSFKRAAIVDNVTGALLGYLDPAQVTAYTVDPTSVVLSATDGWVAPTGDTFKAATMPTVKSGYVADTPAVNSYQVTPDSGDLALTVTYTGTAQVAAVVYVDEDNNQVVLHRDELTDTAYNTHSYSKVRQALLAGYTALGYVYDRQEGNALDANNIITFDDDSNSNQLTTIYLKHGHTVATPDQPGQPETTIPNNPNEWPAGTYSHDLTRQVTAKAQFVYSDGGKVAPDQITTATFKRAAIVDSVTGALVGYLNPDQVTAYEADPTSVTLSQTAGWQPATATARFTMPAAKAGYSPDLAQLQDVTLTPTIGDSVLTVTYSPDPQKATVTYVDATNNNAILKVDHLTGTTGSTEDYSKVRTAVLAGFTDLGYVYSNQTGNALGTNQVVTFDADANQDQATTIYLTHQILTVTPEQPGVPGQRIPDNPNEWPAGTYDYDLTRTIHETIQYVYADGGKVVPDYHAAVTLQRVALVDAVTGQVTHYLSPADLYAYENKLGFDYLGENEWAARNGIDLDPVTSPRQAGYTADKANVGRYQVTPDMGDLFLTVTYTKDTQKATIQYVDLDTNNAVLQADQITGLTDTDFDYTKARNVIQSGYEKLGYVVDHTDLPSNNVITFDHDSAADQTATIYLKHQTVTVTPDQPQTPDTSMPNNPNTWPAGTSAKDLNRTVTETVQYVYSDGGKVGADQHQQVTFQRAAIVDAVTGTVLGYLAPDQVAAYQADPTSVILSDNGWNTSDATLNSLTSLAAKAGYTADLAATQAYTVTPTTGDFALTVTYTPNQQQATIQYVDLTAGIVLQSKVVTGVSNGTLDYSQVRQAIQAGYTKLGYAVAHTDLPANNVITFDTDDARDQSFTVYLTHGTTTVTPEQPQTPGTMIPNNPNTWPAGTNTQDLNRTVTETVEYVYADGGRVAADQLQQVTFQRAAIVDNVTGTLLGYLAPSDVVAYQADPTSVVLSNDGWTTANATFAALTNPTAKAGYTADTPSITAYTVTPTTGDLKLTVTYQADAQTATVVYRDATTGTVLQTDTLTGVTNGTQDYSKVRQAIQTGYEKLGYVYAGETGNALNVANVVTFDSDTATDQQTIINLTHGTTTVTPEQPQTPGTTIPNNPNTWPAGTNTQDLNRTVTETIQYVYADGGKVAPDYHNSVTFQRVAVVDNVTGTLLGYLAPTDVAAYQANPTSVALSDSAWTPITGNLAAVTSPTSKAGYTADLAAVSPYAVNANTGNLTLTVTYNADAQQAMINYVDDDANGAQVHQDRVSGVTNGTYNYAQVQQAIEHGFTDLGYDVVSSDLPAGSMITFDDQDQTDQIYTVHLRHRTSTATEWQVVTETVHYVYANGTKAAPTVTDHVTFTRQKTTDQVTGKVTFTTWTATNGDTTFDVKTSPVIAGYVADQAQIAAIPDLTAAHANVTATVTYRKLGGYVTNVPGQPTIPYPNNSGQPDQPDTSQVTIPYVPGEVPYGPDGKPLQPVNPDDPSKGYVPPAPTDPTTDTPITYQPITPMDNGGTTTPGQPDDKTPTSNGGTTTPGQPGDNTSMSAQPTMTNNNNVVTPTRIQSMPAKKMLTAKTTQTLPQTGESDDAWLASIGLTVLGSIGLLGAAKLRKRDDDSYEI